MFHFENAYHIPNSCVLAWSCKTNLPSNTAFRGFGGPQGMFAGEHIIRHVAETLRKDVVEIGINSFNSNILSFLFFKSILFNSSGEKSVRNQQFHALQSIVNELYG